MSDLDNAINSINASAAKAENTAGFLDDMSTFDDQSSVTNPNNGQTVASIPKQVKDRTDELFTAAESDINQAVSDAEQSATDAQDAADSIGRYQGLWPDTGGSADKGDTYQTQVSGTPTGQYFTALQNTTVDPTSDNVNWREVVSGSSIGLQEVTATGTTTPRRLEERFSDRYNVLDNGADKTGINSSADTFIESVIKTKVLEVPPGSYLIDKDFTVPNTCIFDIKGKLILADGVKVTFNGDIDAGHYQIFELGVNSEVLPSYWDNSTPESQVPAIKEVKAAWFGVKGGAKHPATVGTSSAGTNSLGDMPTGFDSTIPMKAAAKFAQYASFHCSWSDELHTICKLILEPNTKIIVKGDNALGSQVFKSEIDRMRSLPDYRTDPDSGKVINSTFDYQVEGNSSQILFVPLTASDCIFGETININQIYSNHLTVLPCGFTGAGWGGLIKNNPLVYAGSTGREAFFNALTQQHFSTTKFVLTQDNLSNMGVDGRTNPCGTIFDYTGYALGDRLRVKGGNFRNFSKFLNILNPEAVEHKVENTSTSAYNDGAIWYNSSGFYSQLQIENTLHLMKGDNQKMFNFIADYSADYQKFSTSARVQLSNSRMEGEDGKSKTIVNANFGQFTISDLDTFTSMSAEDDASISANLQRLATAEFSNCSLPNKFSVTLAEFNGSNPDIDKYAGLIRSPMLTFTACNFSGLGGKDALIHRSTFNGVPYGQAVLNQAGNENLRVPTVKISEAPNTSRAGNNGFYVPFCTYYGTDSVPEGYDKAKLFAKTNTNGFQYATLNTVGWQFPPWARISKLLLTQGPTADNFTHIVISIGDGKATEFKRIFSLAEATGNASWYNEAWSEIDLLKDVVSSASGISAAGLNPLIGTPTGDPEKLYTRIYYTDASGTPIAGSHPPTKFNIEYRAMREPSEVVNIGESGANIR